MTPGMAVDKLSGRIELATGDSEEEVDTCKSHNFSLICFHAVVTKPGEVLMEIISNERKIMQDVRPESWINIAAPIRDAISILLRFCSGVQEKMFTIT